MSLISAKCCYIASLALWTDFRSNASRSETPRQNRRELITGNYGMHPLVRHVVGWKKMQGTSDDISRHQISKIDSGPPSPPLELTLTFPHRPLGGHLVGTWWFLLAVALSLVASLFNRSWTARVHPNGGPPRLFPRSRRIASSSLLPLPLGPPA